MADVVRVTQPDVGANECSGFVGVSFELSAADKGLTAIIIE